MGGDSERRIGSADRIGSARSIRSLTRHTNSSFALPTAGDGATGIPTTLWGKFKMLVAVLLTIVGQSMQNICLPLALSGGDDMGVVLCYTTFVYFVFFTLLDVILDAVVPRLEHVSQNMSHRHLAVVGLMNALNGVGAIFGGSSDRTPLTLQMSFFLFSTLFAPWYKLLRHTIGSKGKTSLCDVPRLLGFRGWAAYAGCAVCYLVATALVLSDKIENTGSGKLNAYCIFFLAGTFFATTYNVEQDIVMDDTSTVALHTAHAISHENLTPLQFFKRDVQVLRRQLTWLFIFGWIGVLLSLIGAGQGGALNYDRFVGSWGSFITFNNKWMNLFNLGYILTFIGNIYVNRFDSSFTMIIANVSAVSSMWPGWVPSISMQTVGFSPNVPKTVISMILSIVAVGPSWVFSQEYTVALTDALEGKRSRHGAKVNEEEAQLYKTFDS